MQKITPFLWYSDQAEEAVRFYISVFGEGQVETVWSLQADSPSGPPGSVKVVEFSLFGQRFTAMKAGPLDPFNHAISLMVNCGTQAEIDRYWGGLLQGGGQEEQCGWLRDRYGLCWQIVPTILMKLMADPDPVKATRVADAMLTMVKFDIAALEKAHAG